MSPPCRKTRRPSNTHTRSCGRTSSHDPFPLQAAFTAWMRSPYEDGNFGPGQGEVGMGHTGMTAPINRILDTVPNWIPFALASGGDHRLEFCYVKALFSGIRALLKKERLEHPVYNLAAGRLFAVAAQARHPGFFPVPHGARAGNRRAATERAVCQC